MTRLSILSILPAICLLSCERQVAKVGDVPTEAEVRKSFENSTRFAEREADQRFTEEALSEFPKGSTLDSFLNHFDLKNAHFKSQPNQEHGHEQGWYETAEGDLMVSATLSEDGVMLLDRVPWILTKAEQADGGNQIQR